MVGDVGCVGWGVLFWRSVHSTPRRRRASGQENSFQRAATWVRAPSRLLVQGPLCAIWGDGHARRGWAQPLHALPYCPTCACSGAHPCTAGSGTCREEGKSRGRRRRSVSQCHARGIPRSFQCLPEWRMKGERVLAHLEPQTVLVTHLQRPAPLRTKPAKPGNGDHRWPASAGGC